jgi:uncharacterized protein (DUF2147 family)
MRARIMIVAALLSLVGAGHAPAAELTASGLWQATDENGQPNAWFLIADRGGGVYSGTVVRMYMKPGEDPNVVCDQCSDDRRGQPWLGLEIIRGMKRDGMKYEDGTILDPRHGSIYKAKMTLTPDGQTLVVRGYLGISLFGQDRTWTRLPDTAFNEIDPRFNPNPPAAALPPPTRKSQVAPKPPNSAAAPKPANTAAAPRPANSAER